MEDCDGSFTESQYITFPDTQDLGELSPTTKTVTENDFLNSVAKKSVYSPHPDYLTGYTGKMRSMKKPGDSHHKEIVPALGYSGSYIGKVDGKLGKINLHRNLISRQEGSKGYESSHVDGRKEYDQSIEGNYRNALVECKCRGQSVSRILEEIITKIHFKFQSIAEMKMRIKSVFEGADVAHDGFIDAARFHLCCVQLNIALPREEFTALISYFDDCNSGDIYYREFINIICAGAYENL